MSEFPPRTIAAFLRSCAGEWLTVRSRFLLQPELLEGPPAAAHALGSPEPAGAAEGPFPVGGDGEGPASGMPEERWHDADKGALLIDYLEPGGSDDAGGLVVTPPAAGGRSLPAVQVLFSAGGEFRRQGAGGEALGGGSWQLWPDGSLELTAPGELGIVRERIWFTKPNLRLRSSVERRHDGLPGRASFSSEIRRVARAAPASS